MIKTTMSQRLCHQCCCNSHELGSTTIATALVIPILPILKLTLLKEIFVLIFISISPKSLGLFTNYEVFLFAEFLSKLPSTKKTRET
jgi:hypothetical protein